MLARGADGWCWHLLCYGQTLHAVQGLSVCLSSIGLQWTPPTERPYRHRGAAFSAVTRRMSSPLVVSWQVPILSSHIAQRSLLRV